MSGWTGLKSVLPAAAACGIAFAGTQFVVSNFVGPQLTDILSSMAAMGALLIVIQLARQRRPQNTPARRDRAGLGAVRRCWWSSCCSGATDSSAAGGVQHSGQMARTA